MHSLGRENVPKPKIFKSKEEKEQTRYVVILIQSTVEQSFNMQMLNIIYFNSNCNMFLKYKGWLLLFLASAIRNGGTKYHLHVSRATVNTGGALLASSVCRNNHLDTAVSIFLKKT